MLTIVRTDSTNPDFIALVRLLDEDLARRDGPEHSFYSQFNKIDTIGHAIVAFEGERPVGCGAIKKFSIEAMEVKRMFVLPDVRKSGVASTILSELERWAGELGYRKCILETGKKQPEAIGLYTKHGYRSIPNYGQYAGVANSLCFEIALDQQV